MGDNGKGGAMRRRRTPRKWQRFIENQWRMSEDELRMIHPEMFKR